MRPLIQEMIRAMTNLILNITAVFIPIQLNKVLIKPDWANVNLLKYTANGHCFEEF